LPQPLLGGVAAIKAVCLYTVFFALGSSSARLYFDLSCPWCRRFTSAAADFFFNRAKCTSCKKVW